MKYSNHQSLPPHCGMRGVALRRIKFDWRSGLCVWRKGRTIRTTCNQLLSLHLLLTLGEWFAHLLPVPSSLQFLNVVTHSIKTQNTAIIPLQWSSPWSRRWITSRSKHKPRKERTPPCTLRAQTLMRLMRAHTCNLSHQLFPSTQH